jgi:TPP-dependent pyruvate/acetoin dehydrogenase alpha subunit
MVERLVRDGSVLREELLRVDAAAAALVDAAVAEATTAKSPEPSELLTNVYVSY